VKSDVIKLDETVRTVSDRVLVIEQERLP